MRHIASLTFSDSLVRKATFAFWRRTVGVGFPLVLAVLAAYVVWLGANGDRSWGVGALGAAVSIGVVFSAALYVLHYRNGRQKLRDMGRPMAEIAADDEGFTVSSGMGSSTLKWSAVQAVWRFEGFWLVLFSKAHFMTLPLGELAPEMQAYILERVTASGGKVDA
ncbi:YcxB family protein [Roseateles sp. NT4]|uniref:YcxB family protein n=1 Tax=Roseateles sp. NT4 TaxID=3453715 RepID=UPI003EE8542F